MCFTRCWQREAPKTDPDSISPIWKWHMLMSFDQLTHDRCLLTRSDKQNMKDTTYASTGLWPEFSNSKPVSASGHFPTFTLISTHFLHLGICYWLCYCFTTPLLHNGTLSCNFSNHLYNFRFGCDYIFPFFPFFP